MITTYFDNASTTPVDRRVIEKMCGLVLGADGTHGNPAANTHSFLAGRGPPSEVEWPRAMVAEMDRQPSHDLVHVCSKRQSRSGL